MNEMQIFNNPEFGKIRTITENGKTLFCGKDVAKALGYKNPSKALTDHCKGVTKRYTPTSSGQQEMNFIPEGDIYRLAARSELPGADAFESWIFDEVLPTIRKTGGYLTPEAAAKLTEGMQNLAARVEALEDAVTDPFRFVPTAPAPLPAGGVPEAAHPGRDYMKRWMRTASDKLGLLTNKFNMGSNAILHKLYGYLEADFGVDLEDERLRIMEQFGLEDCSTLKAVFYDEDLRDRLEELMDYNLAPENRGW